MASILRTAHGSAAGALLVAERPPLDELQPLNADDTAQGLSEAKRRGRPFQLGNAAAENRKPSMCSLGIEATSPKYKAALKKAARYRQHRMRELAVLHGGHVSAAVAAMIGSGARALAGSIVLAELADEALRSGNAKGNRNAAGMLAQSARLADSSRQQELTAIAICERESKARVDARSNETPDWLLGKPASPAKITAPSKSAIEGSALSVMRPTDHSPPSVVEFDGADACDPDGEP